MTRIDLLNRLLRLDEKLPGLLASLSSYGWDSKTPLVQLDRTTIMSVLERYLQSRVTAPDIELWANAVEGRDDIGYEKGYEKLILLILHELANPILTQPLSKESATVLVNRLKQSA